MNRRLMGPLFACLGLATPLWAAEPEPTATATSPAAASPAAASPAIGAEAASETKPAKQCLADLRTFDSQMESDGYWLGGSGYSYGYPMGGYGYGYPTFFYRGGAETSYRMARPGSDVRTLVASANILARQGQNQQCEDVLATTRIVYKQYIADQYGGKVPTPNLPGWREQQIAAAQSVTANGVSYRSDELLNTDVRDPQNQALGSVNDLLMAPTGKIAYLILSRGGIFGIDAKYVPVPWEYFKITPNGTMLVLDTSVAALDAAPRVEKEKFRVSGYLEQQSGKVDVYWKTHVSDKASN